MAENDEHIDHAFLHDLDPQGGSAALREWSRNKALQLQEAASTSEVLHKQILDKASKQRQELYAKRSAKILTTKTANREKEKAYRDEMEKVEQSENHWELVTAIIGLGKETSPRADDSRKASGTEGVKPGSFAKSSPRGSFMQATFDNNRPQKLVRPGGTSDLTRMQQILLKLKQGHQRPAS